MKFVFSTLVAFLITASLVSAQTRHTIRIQSEKSGKLVFSPDSSKLVLLADRQMYFVSVPGGELVGKIRKDAIDWTFPDNSRVFAATSTGVERIDFGSGNFQRSNVDRQEGFLGINLELKNGKLLVKQIHRHGPVGKSGRINVGDELVGVAEGNQAKFRSVIGLSAQVANNSLKDLADTNVRLRFIPKGKFDEIEVSLKRSARRIEGKKVRYLPKSRNDLPPVGVFLVLGGDAQRLEVLHPGTGKSLDIFDFENLMVRRSVPIVLQEQKKIVAFSEFTEPPENAPSHIDEEREKRRTDSKPKALTAAQMVMQGARENTRTGLPKPRYYGIEVYDYANGKIESRFPVETSDISVSRTNVTYGVHMIPNSNRLAFATRRRIRVYDVMTQEKKLQFEPEPDNEKMAISSFAVSEAMFAVGNFDGQVRLFDSNTAEFKSEIKNRETKSVNAMAMSPDGKWLAYTIERVLHIVELPSD